MICEYCHGINIHHPRCPSTPEPVVRGLCEQCGAKLYDCYEYFVDSWGYEFCSEECAIIHNGIESKEWD